MVTVVGLGPGNPNYITPAAIKCIEEAEIIIGARRLLEAIDTTGKEVFLLTSNVGAALRAIYDHKERNTVVVVSGDPGFYSFLATVRKHLPDIPVRAVPGISSVQLLFGLIGQPWNDVTFASVHGRSFDELDRALENSKKICVLTDDKLSGSHVAQRLQEAGIKGRAVAGKDLSYPNQVVIDTTIDELAGMEGLESCVLYIEIGD